MAVFILFLCMDPVPVPGIFGDHSGPGRASAAPKRSYSWAAQSVLRPVPEAPDT